MSVLAADVIPWDRLADVVIAAFAAGVGVAAIFGISIYGATKMSDARRAGNAVAAAGFAVVAAVSFAVVVAAVAFGLVVMTTK